MGNFCSVFPCYSKGKNNYPYLYLEGENSENEAYYVQLETIGEHIKTQESLTKKENIDKTTKDLTKNVLVSKLNTKLLVSNDSDCNFGYLKKSCEQGNRGKIDILQLAENIHTEKIPPSSHEERQIKAYSERDDMNPDAFFGLIKSLEKKCRSEDQFLRIVAKYPKAVDMLSSHRLKSNYKTDSVAKLYQYSRQYILAGHVVAQLAYKESTIDKRIEMLHLACQLYSKSGSTKGECLLSCTKEQITLLEKQSYLEKETGKKLFIDCSIIETIDKLLGLLSEDKKYFQYALDLSKQFSVPTKQFWFALLQSLSLADQLDLLVELIHQIDPPIGYLPIVETLLQGNRSDLAQEVYTMIKDEEELRKVEKAFNQSIDGTAK